MNISELTSWILAEKEEIFFGLGLDSADDELIKKVLDMRYDSQLDVINQYISRNKESLESTENQKGKYDSIYLHGIRVALETREKSYREKIEHIKIKKDLLKII